MNISWLSFGPPDFVTIRVPLYAIATQRRMLMIVSFGLEDKDAC